MVDYRDRISVSVWVVLLGLTATLLVNVPSIKLIWIVFGSPLTIQLSASLLFSVLLVALAASGTESVVRAHPLARSEQLRNRWIFWAVPCALVAVSSLLLRSAPTRLNWLLGLALSGAALGLTLAATYHAIDPEEASYRPARIALNLLTYLVVMLLFLVVYRQRARSLLSASQTVGISALLALELLRGIGRPLRFVGQYALIIGLVLGEITWALNYWPLPGLTGGLLLLLGFYVMVGLAIQGLLRRLTPRVLLEFGAVAAVSLLLIWGFAPR